MSTLGSMRRNLNMRDKNFDHRIFKKNPEELQQYMMFKRRGSKVESKKGKGSFKRKPKHKPQYED
jgi:stalled ribosome alternative rescue factor ArfA